MTTIFRLIGANFAGKGLPNLFPFVAKEDMEYAFDFRNRASRLLDLVGKHVITPKRNDPSASIVNVTDPTIITTADNGLGITVDMGYLQCNVPVTAIPAGGAKQFTFMVVGGYSGLVFPVGKRMSGTAPNVANLLDYGSHVAAVGIAIDHDGMYTSNGKSQTYPRIEAPVNSFLDVPVSPAYTSKTVTFLSYDGTNWKFYAKSRGYSAAGTNTELVVENNPLAVNSEYTQGFMSLGGFMHGASTLHAGAPTLYQQAMWNRVLTDAEVEAQYQMTKSNFAALSL